jgi:hypothetical protein
VDTPGPSGGLSGLSASVHAVPPRVPPVESSTSGAPPMVAPNALSVHPAITSVRLNVMSSPAAPMQVAATSSESVLPKVETGTLGQPIIAPDHADGGWTYVGPPR